jgi:hypothetical protein
MRHRWLQPAFLLSHAVITEGNVKKVQVKNISITSSGKEN